MILLGGVGEGELGGGGGLDVARNAGTSSRKPKKATRYRPKKRPMIIRKNEKMARFRFKAAFCCGRACAIRVEGGQQH